MCQVVERRIRWGTCELSETWDESNNHLKTGSPSKVILTVVYGCMWKLDHIVKFVIPPSPARGSWKRGPLPNPDCLAKVIQTLVYDCFRKCFTKWRASRWRRRQLPHKSEGESFHNIKGITSNLWTKAFPTWRWGQKHVLYNGHPVWDRSICYIIQGPKAFTT